ncbi:hypothetical protein V6N13_065492 [Hibiscus sabdariffa]
MGKSTVEHSEFPHAVGPTFTSSMSAHFPTGFNIGPLNVNTIPTMDVDMGSSGDENMLIQPEIFKRPRMYIERVASSAQSNSSSFENVVSDETHSEISTGLLN